MGYSILYKPNLDLELEKVIRDSDIETKKTIYIYICICNKSTQILVFAVDIPRSKSREIHRCTEGTNEEINEHSAGNVTYLTCRRQNSRK